MSRARNTFVAATAFAMLASACSALHTPSTQGQTPGTPNPANSILVSVPSDTVYMVDPANGAVAPVASGLTDFQSGYASWSPKHKRIAYGQAGIRIITPGSSHVGTLARGQLVSMPSWSPNGKQVVYGNGTAMFIKTLSKPGAALIRLQKTLAPYLVRLGQGKQHRLRGTHLELHRRADVHVYQQHRHLHDPQRRLGARPADDALAGDRSQMVGRLHPHSVRPGEGEGREALRSPPTSCGRSTRTGPGSHG